MRSQLFLFAFCLIINQVVSQPHELGLNPHDWGALSHYHKKDSLNCLDLLKVSSHLERETLILKCAWNDQVADAKRITQDIRRWKDPQGKIRDKDLMYFYDNLGIRIFYQEYFYEGWVWPNEQQWQVQWENQGSMKTRTSAPTEVVDIDQQSIEDFRMDFSFDRLNWEVSDQDTIRVTIIAADSDAPVVKDFKKKLEHGSSYCTSTKSFILKSDN